MDQVKEAFVKVKQDIFNLQEELFYVRKEIEELKNLISDLVFISQQVLDERKKGLNWINKEADMLPTQEVKSPTEEKKIPTENNAFKPLKPQNIVISTGNEGVPTDRQTNQQTNQQTHFSSVEQEKQAILKEKGVQKEEEIPVKKDSFKEAVSVLESLDNIKKELRLKFKRLTEQEILVFSTLYQLEEEKGYADYKSISFKLNLTESSIRDYVGKLIKKGIPVDKIKINNKTVQLGISPNLKKIATLSTILLLRDI